MTLIPYIFGIIGLLVTSTIVVLLNNAAGFNIHSLSIRFIIPIWGILLWLGWAWWFFLAKRFTNSKMTNQDYIVAIVLGLLTFIGVNYISYQSTYVMVDENDKVSIKNQFSQPQDYTAISQVINFMDYMNMINSSSSYQFRYRGAIKIGDDFDIWKTSATILFYIQLIWVLLWSLMMAWILESARYCKECNVYYKKKSLKSFDTDFFEKMIDSIAKNIQDGKKLKKTIEKIEEKKNDSRMYWTIDISYCPKCYNGVLNIRLFKYDSKEDIVEIDKLKQEIELKSGVIRDLIH